MGVLSNVRSQTIAAAASLFAIWQAVSLAQQPKFEVASIKRNTSGQLGVMGRGFEGTTFTVLNAPVQRLISDAYGVPGRDLMEAPSWIFSVLLGGDSERYDVIAKFAEGSSAQNQRAMLQNLLAERFSLRLHRETRELPVYIVTKLNNSGPLGPNLRSAVKNCLPATACEGRIAGGFATYTGSEWSNVLQALSAGLAGERLVDRTGLSGIYDFSLAYTPVGVTRGDLGVDFFTAVREQLGLRLERGRAPFEVLVIDAISRPTPD